jgi:hypothetical protein
LVAVEAKVVNLMPPVRQRDGIEEEERPRALGADPLQHIVLNQILGVDRTDAHAIVAR